jgi:hypothetical protein
MVGPLGRHLSWSSLPGPLGRAGRTAGPLGRQTPAFPSPRATTDPGRGPRGSPGVERSEHARVSTLTRRAPRRRCQRSRLNRTNPDEASLPPGRRHSLRLPLRGETPQRSRTRGDRGSDKPAGSSPRPSTNPVTFRAPTPARPIPEGDFYHSLGLPQRSAGYPRSPSPTHDSTLKELATESRRWTHTTPANGSQARATTDPGGVTEGHRGSSAATTPGPRHPRHQHPEGGAR